MAADAALNQSDINGCTPLFQAAQEGHEAVVQQLVAAGAAVDQADAQGRTPLWVCAMTGHLAAARLLLAGGADANVDPGISALSCAVRFKHEAVAALLRASGATE